LIEQVDRGLYRLVDAPVTELSSLAEVSKRVPHAIICLLSALQVHRMTTESPHAVWVLLDRHARTPKITSPSLEVVRASGAALGHGVERKTIDGVNVQITTPPKTVADCFRFRRHVGLRSQGRGFGPRTTVAAIPPGATALWLGDLNGDGRADACVDLGATIACAVIW